MNWKSVLILVGCSILVSEAAAQNNEKSLADSVIVHKLLDSSKVYINSDPERSLEIAQEARKLAHGIGFVKGEALALKNMGLVYYFQSKNVQTLQFWNESLSLLQQLKDDRGVANLYGNIGAVYANQGDEVNALKYHLESLRLAERTGDEIREFYALNNIAGIYFEKKGTWDKALDYLLKAFPLAEKTNNKEALGLILGNIGEIYFEQGNFDKASEYYNKSLRMGATENSPFALNGLGKLSLKRNDFTQALKYHNEALGVAEKLNDIHKVNSLQGIANVYLANKDYKLALEYFNKAEITAVQQKSFPSLKVLYEQMATTYADIGDHKQAFAYQKQLGTVKDTLFSETAQKKLGLLQFEFDLEKKQGEIKVLTKDKALREEQLNRQRLAKNAFMVGLFLLGAIIFIIYRSYRMKVRTNKILDRQNEQIEGLLLNILPHEVKKELQTTGYATPRSYQSASVLFTDFKGFTQIADKLSPESLVRELNNCFIAFDNIIEKYGLEKIKTIGDSYMCAGGIPTPDDEHPYKIVRAGLEIQNYIVKNNLKRKAEGLQPWDIRIGIHVGPVVAGVVGKKKYAYDIWGSTVNIASRMESSGVPGQVNISSATYELVKDQFNCIHRGKILAKNLGEIDMYLIEHDYENGEELFKENQLVAEQHENVNLLNPSIIM
ncbi:MAG TPA: adenylate/guanylate cyclase domain-containing protein [Chitinophagaceae bacterium]